jgi:hypothetical protein
MFKVVEAAGFLKRTLESRSMAVLETGSKHEKLVLKGQHNMPPKNNEKVGTKLKKTINGSQMGLLDDLIRLKCHPD